MHNDPVAGKLIATTYDTVPFIKIIEIIVLCFTLPFLGMQSEKGNENFFPLSSTQLSFILNISASPNK
jgi:hypothetical protein